MGGTPWPPLFARETVARYEEGGHGGPPIQALLLVSLQDFPDLGVGLIHRFLRCKLAAVSS